VLIIAKGEKPEWYKDTACFAQAENRTAVCQLLASVLPYLGLVAAMVYTVQQGYPYCITLLLAVLAVTFFIRIFIFFHDCTHGSFFSSPRWNRNVGYICGILTFTAFHDWRRSHTGHHISAGDLDRRGMVSFSSMQADRVRQKSG